MRKGDGIKPRGKLEVIVTRGVPRIVPGNLLRDAFGKVIRPGLYDSRHIDLSHVDILSRETHHNLIVNGGKDAVITGLTTGSVLTIVRMAIGCEGTIPTDQTVPKTPVSTMTALYSEVYRADIDVTTLTVAVPFPGPYVHQVQFTKTFSAVSIPSTSFANQANPIINEVGLILANLVTGAPLPRPAVAAPAAPDADEMLFSIRTFNSVPFLAANQISITIDYTIFTE